MNETLCAHFAVLCMYCKAVMCGDCLEELDSEELVFDKDEIAVCRACKDKVKLRVWNEWAKGEGA